MNFLKHALAAGVLLAPATLFADPPRGDDEVLRLRERVDEMRRELESAGDDREPGMDENRARRLAEDLARRAADDGDKAERSLRLREEDERSYRRAGGDDNERRGAEDMERRRMENREGGDRPGRPGMTPPPDPVAPPRVSGSDRAFGGGSGDQEFELKMRAREIQHQIENLKWELETIELRLQHLRKGGGQPGRTPQDKPSLPNFEKRAPQPDGPRGGDMENLKGKLEGLVDQLRQAEKNGRKEVAEKLRHEIERIKNALQGGGEGKRPPTAAGPQDRERLVAEIEAIRKKLHAARESGNERAVKECEELLARRMKSLSGSLEKNVDEKRSALKERAGARLRELEEKLAEAKENGDRGAAKELMAEIQKIREMVEKELAPEKPKQEPRKKPRMI